VFRHLIYNYLYIKKIGILNLQGCKCSFCNVYSGKNKASLGVHMKNCKLNPKNISEVDNVIISDEEKENEPKKVKEIRRYIIYFFYNKKIEIFFY
jgi:hypothetical protein